MLACGLPWTFCLSAPQAGRSLLECREPRRRPEPAARESGRRDGMAQHTCPFHPGGTEGRLQTQSSRNPPGPAASTELPSGPPPPDPWPRMEPGQMVEAQTWDPSPKTAQALSYGHRIREALPWVWAWKIFRCKRLGKHLLILITKILSFSAPRNLNLFFQLQL